jgi:hypothetical protein
MSQETTALPASISTVQPPWKQSAKGSVYCMWGSLPEDVKSQLKQEDKFGITAGDFHYNVKQNQDGGYIVFRNTKAEYDARSKQQSFKKLTYRTVEVQALPIEEANKLLAAFQDYELVGTDPVKVLNGELFVVIGKKEMKNDEAK